jgi:PST family polysaccharide transporter
METDKLIVGWLLGVKEAGLYFMTQRVGVLPTQELLSPLQRILFPAFAEVADDTPRLRRVACESINVIASLGLPAGFGFALIAGDFVPLALGAQWTPIVPLLVVLVPYLGLRSVLSMTLPFILALGRTRMLFWVSLVYALVHVPVFIAGTALFGLAGSIWSIVAAGLFYSYLNAWMLKETLGISLDELLYQVRRPVAATVVMVAAVVGFGAAMPLSVLTATGSWVSLATKIVVGGAVFCGAQFAFWRLEGQPAGIERRLVQMMSR